MFSQSISSEKLADVCRRPLYTTEDSTVLFSEASWEHGRDSTGIMLSKRVSVKQLALRAKLGERL